MATAREHFTVGEVEALIPALERIFVQVLQLRAGLRALGQKLDRAGVKLDRQPEEVGRETEIESGTPAVRQAKAVFRGLDEALNDEIERIRALGGEVKDLDLADGEVRTRHRHAGNLPDLGFPCSASALFATVHLARPLTTKE